MKSSNQRPINVVNMVLILCGIWYPPAMKRSHKMSAFQQTIMIALALDKQSSHLTKASAQAMWLNYVDVYAVAVVEQIEGAILKCESPLWSCQRSTMDCDWKCDRALSCKGITTWHCYADQVQLLKSGIQWNENTIHIVPGKQDISYSVERNKIAQILSKKYIQSLKKY